MEANIFFSDAPERDYGPRADPETLRRLGQFFTPFAVARCLAVWVCGAACQGDLLDPAVGLGVFFRAVLSQSDHPFKRMVGYDVDERLLTETTRRFEGLKFPPVMFRREDYLSADWDARYAGVVCNPPYHRFQDYPLRNQILPEFRRRLGLSLPGAVNLHSLFLLKSAFQLAEQGRAAYLVPTEWLNADYGVPVKRALLQQGLLRAVIVFQGSLFERALTTSSLILLEKSAPPSGVPFAVVDAATGLEELEVRLRSWSWLADFARVAPLASLDPAVKWRMYYDVPLSERRRGLPLLAAYGRVIRGVATGDNDFFTFDERRRKAFGIDTRHLSPCIVKAGHVTDVFFTQDHFEKLKRAGKRVYLLNIQGPSSPELRRYLQLGEARGVHLKHLPSRRSPWFAPEKRSPAPLLISAFARNGPKVVRNETSALNLTCFHGLYPNIFVGERLDLLTAWLLTDVARELFRANRREYGGGLEKYEPGDLAQTPVIDVSAVPAVHAREILKTFSLHRRNVLDGVRDLSLIRRLNRLFTALIG